MSNLVIFAAILSIIHANGWIIIPTAIRVGCWILAVLFGTLYSYGKGIGDSISAKVKKEMVEKK